MNTKHCFFPHYILTNITKKLMHCFIMVKNKFQYLLDYLCGYVCFPLRFYIECKLFLEGCSWFDFTKNSRIAHEGYPDSCVRALSN